MKIYKTTLRLYDQKNPIHISGYATSSYGDTWCHWYWSNGSSRWMKTKDIQEILSVWEES